jgi:hypothetical protein
VGFVLRILAHFVRSFLSYWAYAKPHKVLGFFYKCFLCGALTLPRLASGYHTLAYAFGNAAHHSHSPALRAGAMSLLHKKSLTFL